jgi:hypothetical protein
MCRMPFRRIKAIAREFQSPSMSVKNPSPDDRADNRLLAASSMTTERVAKHPTTDGWESRFVVKAMSRARTPPDAFNHDRPPFAPR